MASAVGHCQAGRLPLSSSTEDKSLIEDTTIEKDIDGVPLRDHKKIDLKLILGHTPEVDDEEDESTSASAAQKLTESVSLPGLSDDEDEYEYGYSDDGNEEGEADDEGEGAHRPRKIQRRSSLRTITSPDFRLSPESPGHKKAVRFADAMGLGLAAVRDLVNTDEPPEIPQSALRDLRIRKRKSKLGDQLHLTLNFVQPSSDPEFMTRLIRQHVILENCVTSDRDLAVSGVIRVANISYEKRVTVRYTVDTWRTFKESPTTYVSNSNDGATDRFMFVIRLPHGFGSRTPSPGTHVGRLEFAIEYRAGDKTYWDSNDGSNYVIDCVPLPVSPQPTTPEVGSSGSDGEFII